MVKCVESIAQIKKNTNTVKLIVQVLGDFRVKVVECHMGSSVRPKTILVRKKNIVLRFEIENAMVDDPFKNLGDGR